MVTTRRPLTVASAIVLVLVGRSAAARADDDWFGRDKGLHAAASAVIAAGSYAASTPWLDDRGSRAAVGASVALAAGIGKELWDAAGTGDASGKDLVWDVIGTAIGVS